MVKGELNDFLKIFEAYILTSLLLNFTYIHFHIYIYILFSIHFKNITSVRKTMLKIYEHVHKNNMNTCIGYIKNSM